MTPAGTPNELDVQNEWEENTHTHTHICQKNIEGHLIGLEILVYRQPRAICTQRHSIYDNSVLLGFRVSLKNVISFTEDSGN